MKKRLLAALLLLGPAAQAQTPALAIYATARLLSLTREHPGGPAASVLVEVPPSLRPRLPAFIDGAGMVYLTSAELYGRARREPLLLRRLYPATVVNGALRVAIDVLAIRRKRRTLYAAIGGDSRTYFQFDCATPRLCLSEPPPKITMRP